MQIKAWMHILGFKKNTLGDFSWTAFIPDSSFWKLEARLLVKWVFLAATLLQRLCLIGVPRSKRLFLYWKMFITIYSSAYGCIHCKQMVPYMRNLYAV